jgi:hypothetical protein
MTVVGTERVEDLSKGQLTFLKNTPTNCCCAVVMLVHGNFHMALKNALAEVTTLLWTLSHQLVLRGTF